MELSINYKKLKILLIKNDLLIDQPISFNNVEIKFVNSYEYMGIDLDNRLNFVTYLNNLTICSAISTKIPRSFIRYVFRQNHSKINMDSPTFSRSSMKRIVWDHFQNDRDDNR
jgi:hypothetical protein